MPVNKIAHTVGDIVGSTINFKTKQIKFDDPYNGKRPLFGQVQFKNMFHSYLQWITVIFHYVAYPVVGLLFCMFIIEAIFNISFTTNNLINKVLIVFFSIPAIMVLLQCFIPSRKFRAKMNRILVESTAHGKKNKAVFKDFTSNKFVLQDFGNIALIFSATKDVSNQLNKIRIKQEAVKSKLRDCKVMRYKPVDERKIWNAYFLFDEIPKDGELKVEWI